LRTELLPVLFTVLTSHPVAGCSVSIFMHCALASCTIATGVSDPGKLRDEK